MSDFKLFAHRGYAKNGATQNSVKSLDMAALYGFKAIEFDVWLLPKRKEKNPTWAGEHDGPVANPRFLPLSNQVEPCHSRASHFEKVDLQQPHDDLRDSENCLIISHDRPNEANQSKMPEFSEFLSYGNALEYWIDLKNATTENSEEFAKKIFNEIRKKDIDFNKVLIAPFITDYQVAIEVLKKFRKVFGEDLRFVCVCEFAAEVKPAIDFIKKNQLKFLSINEKLIDEKLIKNLPTVEILAWTVNDQKRLEELVALQVRNFATDEITPK